MNHPSIPENSPDVTSETQGFLALCRTVDFYSSSVSGGQAQSFLGYAVISTDGTGQSSTTTVTLPATTSKGTWLTATASEESGANTSELSNAFQLTLATSQLAV